MQSDAQCLRHESVRQAAAQKVRRLRLPRAARKGEEPF